MLVADAPAPTTISTPVTGQASRDAVLRYDIDNLWTARQSP